MEEILQQMRTFIDQQVRIISMFVGALNPGLMMQFNVVLRNLEATIGVALEPVIAQAAQMLRIFAGMLMPLMTELRPLIADISATLSDVLVTVLGIIITQLKTTLMVLRPTINMSLMLLNIVAQFIDVLTLLANVLWGFADFDAMMKSVNDSIATFKSVLIQCVQGLVVLTVALLRMLGAVRIITDMRTALEKRIAERRGAGPGGVVAAPRDVSTSGAEDIAKRMAERAFAAVSGATARSDTELMEGILDAVNKGANLDLRAIIADGVKAGMDAARREIADTPIVRHAETAAHTVADLSVATVSPPLAIFQWGKRQFE